MSFVILSYFIYLLLWGQIKAQLSHATNDEMKRRKLEQGHSFFSLNCLAYLKQFTFSLILTNSFRKTFHEKSFGVQFCLYSFMVSIFGCLYLSSVESRRNHDSQRHYFNYFSTWLWIKFHCLMHAWVRIILIFPAIDYINN